ncbi:MAG: Heme biosynthesis protein related to NirL and NirH [Candidatus Ozemobacter sibiricus]|jgi:DNA-binding Lrp family transcriptional regulator|uniref:siroheme decarboxylase n=1 Tax=Candidatus Ozemobacter sibiricus TaxID=2268124 RepID=A0A367ZRT9_9BACT|nr:MAG: Heme biosynthesis protein related to NirL and NirH [Candidatus Ozemobacter sibiricus]
MVEMSLKERNLLKELEGGFKLERSPFKRIARELGYTEQEVIETIKKFRDNGVIRRIGIAVRPERLGQTCNALVVWDVPQARVEEVGTLMAARPEISHCYDRETPAGWTGNLFTMIHAKDELHLAKILSELTEATGLHPVKILRTVRELKKTSMRYFTQEADES